MRQLERRQYLFVMDLMRRRIIYYYYNLSQIRVSLKVEFDSDEIVGIGVLFSKFSSFVKH